MDKLPLTRAGQATADPQSQLFGRERQPKPALRAVLAVPHAQ